MLLIDIAALMTAFLDYHNQINHQKLIKTSMTRDEESVLKTLGSVTC